MKKKQEAKVEAVKKAKVAGTICNDRDCPTHGKLKTHGRTFEGRVVSKHNRRIAIEFERMVYVRKYERYSRFKTKIHARLPNCMEEITNIGDLIRIAECRPLSKIIHFVVVGKVNVKGDKKQ